MLGLVIAYGSWAVFSSIFICYPVNYSWDKTIQDGRCMNEMIVWFTNAGMSKSTQTNPNEDYANEYLLTTDIGEDIIILLLPLPVIQTLHMPRGQKQGLIIMLLLGARYVVLSYFCITTNIIYSVTVISIVRLYSLDDISNSIDISFDNVAHATLSDIEVNVGIICACLPAMRPLFALIVPEYFSAAPHYTHTKVVDIEKSGHLRTPSSSGKNTGQTNTPRTGRSRTSTPRTGTPRSSTPRTGTPRAGTPRAVTPSLPRPTISRTSTGLFAVNHPNRPHTPGQSSGNHSRSGSNTSIDTAKIRSPPAARLPLSVSSRPNTPRQYSQTTVKHSRSASNLSADQSGRFPVSSSSRTFTPRPNVVKHSRSASNITVDTGLARAQPPRFQGRVDPLRMSPVSPPTAMRFSSLSPFTNPRPIHEVFGHARSSSVPPRMPGSTKPLPVTPFPVAGRP